MPPASCVNTDSKNIMQKITHYEAVKGDCLAKEAFRHTGSMLGFKLADVVAWG